MPEQLNYKEKQGQRLKLLDFWAPWCGACQKLMPTIDALEMEYMDKVPIERLNVDDKSNKELMKQYDIKTIPTVIFLVDGIEVDRVKGAQTKETYQTIIKDLFKK